MKRSDIIPMPPHFDQYILQVPDIELHDAFEQSGQQLEHTDMPLLQAIGDKVYAPGKWTIPDILLHITDTERVMAYRALRFARNDATPLMGFDQDVFTKNANAGKRTFQSLLDELQCVRRSSVFLFNSFGEVELLRKGVCSGVEMSVLALGFMIIGHQQHHMNIIKERYLPLAEKQH